VLHPRSRRRQGHRVLLFSQWTKILDVIQYCLFIGLLGDIKYMRLDGSTNVEDRQALVDQYNNSDECVRAFVRGWRPFDACVFRAGGPGLPWRSGEMGGVVMHARVGFSGSQINNI
jgi:hypothetical protein